MWSQRSHRSCRSLQTQFEIIVVDDGISDHTGEIADALAAANPSVRVVHSQRAFYRTV